MSPTYARLRNLAALLATLSGAALAAALWFLPTTPGLLMTALCGAVYLLLGLGLFGISRFSLFVGVILPAMRAWTGLWPLPIEIWEQLRMIVDIALAAICIPVLWASLTPDYHQTVRGTEDDHHA